MQESHSRIGGDSWGNARRVQLPMRGQDSLSLVKESGKGLDVGRQERRKEHISVSLLVEFISIGQFGVDLSVSSTDNNLGTSNVDSRMFA